MGKMRPGRRCEYGLPLLSWGWKRGNFELRGMQGNGILTKLINIEFCHLIIPLCVRCSRPCQEEASWPGPQDSRTSTSVCVMGPLASWKPENLTPASTAAEALSQRASLPEFQNVARRSCKRAAASWKTEKLAAEPPHLSRSNRLAAMV